MESEKYALITGGTSGIGYELTKLFVQDGYNVIIVARFSEELEKAAMELSLLKSPALLKHDIKIITITKDLFHPQAAYEIYNEVKTRGIMVDVLVNNAGQGVYGFFAETDIQDDLAVIQLNIISFVMLTKLFLKDMLKRNEGKILQLGSIASKLPAPLHSVYGGTKAFILYFSEAIANELKDSNVTVTTLMPGPTDTDFFRKGGFAHTKMVQEGNLSDPAEVAKDGYNALMAGETRIISGFKNKLQVNLPDETGAEQIRKQMEPSSKEGMA
jgi:uncharacterized protein